MNHLKLAAVLAIGTLLPTAAFAATCPALTGADPTYVTAGAGCNTLITLNSDGSVNVTIPNANPYDGTEDNYVGVINNSGHTVSSLTLSGSNIFGFDGDGIDAFGISGNATDNSPSNLLNGLAGYGGSNAYFTIVDANDGTVNFINAISATAASVGSFSLEEAPSASGLTSVTVGGAAAPEPSSLILLGTGALGIAGSFRRRILAAIR